MKNGRQVGKRTIVQRYKKRSHSIRVLALKANILVCVGLRKWGEEIEQSKIIGILC
jgi:hypothetical protein